MCRKFNGDIGILLQQLHQLIQGRSRLRTKSSLVEIIEYVLNKHRCRDVCQGELQGVLFRLRHRLHLKFLLMIKETLAGAKEHIAHTRFYLLFERSVTFDTEFKVGAVVAHHINLCCRQFIAFLLIDPPLDSLRHLRFLKRVNMVPSPCIAAVAAEVTPVAQSLKGHAEVVALGIKRKPWMLYRQPIITFAFLGYENVQTTHTRMSVRREIEITVRTEGREKLIARSIDGRSKVLYHPHAVTAPRQLDTPDVVATQAATHVADEVKPLAIR